MIGNRLLRRMALTASIGIVSLTAGCTTWWNFAAGSDPRQEVSSSLVDYLYPQSGRRHRAVEVGVPARLEVPLRVGLAFVPARAGHADLPEARKAQLLGTVQAHFSAQRYIERIEVIPTAYLRDGGSFGTLERVAGLHGVDVMALVSYDQLAIADDNTGSLLYWTLVGAYLVEGSRNDVSTFVDIAVFDVNTRRLLLRAPGVNELRASSTLVTSPERLRAARTESFAGAIADMTDNLEAELARFRRDLEHNADVHIASRNGAGATPWLALLIMLVIVLVASGSRR